MKYSIVQATLASLLLLTVRAVHAATLTWDNGASTGNWNNADENWTGSMWSNSNPDDAVFHSVGGVIALEPGITAGTVSVGNTGGNFASLTFSGGSLNATSLAVQGFGSNGGNYAANPTLTVNSTVNISGDAGVGRSNLDITGGSFTANRIISAAGSADWGRLVVSGGTVTATAGVDGSVNTGATFAIDLNGGTLATPSIKVADRELGTNNNAWLTFNGGTLSATADTTSFITTYGGGNKVFIAAGGAFIDSNGHEITIGTASNGGGALTKNGAGTLTLTASNNHTGGTTVNQGTLLLAVDWALNNVSSGGVTVGAGAILRADASLANQLNGLTLNDGTVDAVNSAGHGDWGNFHLTGNVTATGTSSLNADVALRASNVDFNVVGGGTLNVGGVLHNGHLFGQNSGSPATVSKNGPGTMILAGNSTYTGATSVQNGTLLINGVYSGGGLITVAAGATLGGNGTMGDVEIADGGILSPGASAGHLTVNHLTLGPNAILNIELGAPTLVQDPGSDFVTVGQILTLGGTLNIQGISGFGTPASGDSWLIMTAANGIADNGMVIGSQPALPGGLTFAIDYSSGAEVFLTVVPEAGTAGLFVLGAFLLRRTRRTIFFRRTS
jgi:fibronectin-binding autotransporter adhesin